MPALTLMWSSEEPARVGEVLCLPRAAFGVPFTIGRATEPGEDRPELLAPPGAIQPPPPSRTEPYTSPDELSREQVLAALAACDGVREQAWRMLGMRSRDQFKRLLKKLALT